MQPLKTKPFIINRLNGLIGPLSAEEVDNLVAKSILQILQQILLNWRELLRKSMKAGWMKLVLKPMSMLLII